MPNFQLLFSKNACVYACTYVCFFVCPRPHLCGKEVLLTSISAHITGRYLFVPVLKLVSEYGENSLLVGCMGVVMTEKQQRKSCRLLELVYPFQ